MTAQKDWFTSWFNTPYYHILYKHRDDSDAKVFMQNITKFLAIKREAHLLDLACGKGRHSVFLNSLGYQVTGVDLSENSISFAQKFANKTLQFNVHDMRDSFANTYDAIFNLFTSFGYFEEDAEDIKVLKNIKNGLQKNGIAVIDFLNVATLKNDFTENELQTIDGIEFRIHKKIENDFIIKEISFEADGESHMYVEKVKHIGVEKFETYFKEAGLTIQHTFGDYQLSPFNEQTSNRLIYVVS
jgi:SAM-dependent methyltransferase